jgi:nitrogen regulatory protein P-II 1
MSSQMTKITIITRREKFEELRVALLEIGVQGMTLTEVEGCGVQHGLELQIRGVKKQVHLLPKIKLEIVVSTVPVEAVIKAAKDVLRTGKIGDGKIFVSEIKEVIRVRTGERNEEALTNNGE